MENKDAKQWLANSKKVLSQLSRFSQTDSAHLKQEIIKRQTLIENLDEQVDNEITAGINSYHIIGFNQNKAESGYTGFLHLKKTGANRVAAEWVIAGEQTQIGTGFFKDDLLVINFSYEGDEADEIGIYKGVVVYKIIQQKILHGIWSEKHGDNAYIGIEEGRKLSDAESIFRNSNLN